MSNTSELNYNEISKDNFNIYIQDFNDLISEINSFLFYKNTFENSDIQITFDDVINENILKLFLLKSQNKDYLNLQNQVYSEINTKFELILKSSIEHKIYFKFCVFETYKDTFEYRLNDYKTKYLGFNNEDFVKKEIEFTINTIEYFLSNEYWNETNKEILKNNKNKIFEFLKNQLSTYTIYIRQDDGAKEIGINQYIIVFDKINENNELKKDNQTVKINKNLLFDGKSLNLLERYQIANKVLDIEKKINALNITKDKKNELLSYILDCNIDNAKKLLNGNYDAKPRNLKSYFKDLDLTE